MLIFNGSMISKSIIINYPYFLLYYFSSTAPPPPQFSNKIMLFCCWQLHQNTHFYFICLKSSVTLFPSFAYIIEFGSLAEANVQRNNFSRMLNNDLSEFFEYFKMCSELLFQNITCIGRISRVQH